MLKKFNVTLNAKNKQKDLQGFNFVNLLCLQNYVTLQQLKEPSFLYSNNAEYLKGKV